MLYVNRMQYFQSFSVQNNRISCCVTEKRMTRGGGLGLEAPDDYIYFTDL